MKTEYYIVPIDHAKDECGYIAWMDMAGNLCVGETQITSFTRNSKPMSQLKIHKDAFLPSFPVAKLPKELDCQLIYQLCGLKQTLLVKFEKVFPEDTPAPQLA